MPIFLLEEEMSRDQTIKATLEIGAKIDQVQHAFNEIQKGLKGFTLTDTMSDSFNKLFKDYKSELDNLSRLTKDNQLTPINEKEIKNSIDRIEKLYRSLIVKLESNKMKTSMLEDDAKALKSMVAAQNEYKAAIEKTQKSIESEQKSINRINEKVLIQKQLLDQVKLAQKQCEEATGKQLDSEEAVTKEIEKQQKEIQKLKNARDTYKDNYRNKNNTNRGYASSTGYKDILTNLANAESQLSKLEALQTAIKAVGDAEKSYAEITKKSSAEIEAKKQNIGALEEALNKLSNQALSKIKTDLQESNIAWQNYGIDINTINSFEDLSAAIERVKNTGGNETSKVLYQIQEIAKSAGVDIRDLGIAFDYASDEMSAMAEHAQDIERMRQSLVRFFSIGNAVQLFKRGIRSAYRTIQDLDKVMTETAVVTKFTVSDMWKQLPEYTARANQLGVTIHDVYESATLYYQQGLKTNEVMAVSNATLKMARIASLDAAEATDRMTNALRGFNMEISESNAERVADVYSKLAAMSASNVDEISTAMTKVASLASNANMQFETTSAFLAQIIETTRESAETAGTALKTVVARFSEVKELFSKGDLLGTDTEGDIIDVNKVSKALRTAGINLNEYLTGAKGLDDIFMELASKWDSLDRVQQRYIATMAAGSRQQSRFIAMMQDYKRTTELVTAAQNAAGASQEQYQKTLDSLESKLNQLKNSWNTFLMDITNSDATKFVIDALKTLLNGVNALTNILPGFTSGIGKLWLAILAGAKVKGVLGKNGPVMNFLSSLFTMGQDSKSIASMTVITGRLIKNISLLGNKIVTVGTASQKTTTRLLEFRKALGLVNADGVKVAGGLSSLIGGLGELALVIIAIIGVIKAVQAVIDSTAEGQLKKLEEKTQQASDAAREASDAYQELKSNLDGLSEKSSKLDTLIKGTAEWKNQLLEVNQEVLTLIDKYPTLVKQLDIDSNGMFLLNTEAILENYRTNMIHTQQLATHAQMNQQQGSLNVAIKNALRSLKGLGLDQSTLNSYAQSIIENGTEGMSTFLEDMNNKNKVVTDDARLALEQYTVKLLNVQVATDNLTTAFFTAADQLQNWTPEEQNTADAYKNNPNIGKSFLKQAEVNYNRQQAPYGKSLGHLGAAYLEKLGYTVNIPDIVTTFSKIKVVDETGESTEYKYNDFLDLYKQKYIEQEAQSMYYTAVSKSKDIDSHYVDILTKAATTVHPEGEELSAQAFQNIFKETGISSEIITQAYADYMANQLTTIDIEDKLKSIIGSNNNIDEEFVASIYSILTNSIKDQQILTDAINHLFDNESIDLTNIESIRKQINFISDWEGVDSSKLQPLIDLLFDITKATSQINPTNFADLSSFVYSLEEAQDTILSKEDYEKITSEFGVGAENFEYIGQDKYKLKIDTDDLYLQLHNILNQLLADANRTRYITGLDEDRTAYNQEQYVAGYYANQGTKDTNQEYYEGAKARIQETEYFNDVLAKSSALLKENTVEETRHAKSMVESAAAAVKYMPKMEELTKVLQDNYEALIKHDLSPAKQKEIAQALSDAFGIEVPITFVQDEENQETLAKWAAGVEGSAEDLTYALLTQEGTLFSQLLERMGDQATELQDWLAGLDFDAEGQAHLDVTQLLAALEAGKISAEELEAALAEAATTIKFEYADEWIEVPTRLAKGSTQNIAMTDTGGITTERKRVRVPVKATLTNASGVQRTVNANSGFAGTTSGGSGGSKEKPKYWDNPYDELYNLIEKQNEALRTREKLEREYDRILRDRERTAKELKQNSLDQIANLRKEIDLQERIQAERLRMMNELKNKTYRDEEGNERTYESWGATKYASYNSKTGLLQIDWNEIDKVNDPELGNAIEAYISKLEELSSSYEETQESIEDMYDQVYEINERGKNEYLEFEERVYQALVQRDQKIIDSYSSLNDTINNSNNRVIDSLRESIDLERQIRDNTKTEDEISDKEARLAYLQRDTSGANQTEILRLQKELEDARESYQDTLIDQAIENIDKENQLAAEQRSRQIEVMQAQLDWNNENGYYWAEVNELLKPALEAGDLRAGSALVALLQETDAFKGMSEFGKEKWMNNLFTDFSNAYQGFTNWSKNYESPEIINEIDVGVDVEGDTVNVDNKIIVNVDNQITVPTTDKDKDKGKGDGGDTTTSKKTTTAANVATIMRGAAKNKIRSIATNVMNGNHGSGYGANVRAGLNKNTLMKYAGGGLADYTGLAWLDGSKAHPEMVLSAQDTENFIALRNTLAQMLRNTQIGGNSNNGDNYFDIQINVDEITSDYDVDKLAARIKKQIYDDSSYRNVNAISYLR